MAEFDKELYMCKALTLETEKEIKGFYFELCGKHFIGDYAKHGEKINPYTLCRNTGIRKNDVYIYENDLVEYSNAFEKGLAIVEFDELEGRYKLRKNIEYTSRTDINRYTIKVIGNIVLSENDFEKFNDYSVWDNMNTSADIEPECRSKAHLNKKAKEFLPK